MAVCTARSNEGCRSTLSSVSAIPPSRTATTVTFMADRTIFTTIDYNFDTLAQRFREWPTLNQRSDHLDARPARPRKSASGLYFEGGIVSFVRALNLSREPLHPKPFYVDPGVGEVAVEVALQYTTTASLRASNVRATTSQIPLTAARNLAGSARR